MSAGRNGFDKHGGSPESFFILQDYTTPDGKVLSRDLTTQLNTAIQFLVECRPLSVSMGNAIKFLKMQVWAFLGVLELQ